MMVIDQKNPWGSSTKKVGPVFIQVLWETQEQEIVRPCKNHLENSG